MSLSPSEPPLAPVALQPEAEEPAKPKRRVFAGPLGLRAGWAIALFLLLTFGLAFGLSHLFIAATGQQKVMREARQTMQQTAKHNPPVAQALPIVPAYINEASTLGATLLAALGLSFIERRRYAVYGLGGRPFFNLIPGALWGLVAMGLLVTALLSAHLLVFDGRLLSGPAMWRFGAAWLILFLLVGMSEEFLFRGYLQFTLERGLLHLAGRIAPGRERTAAFWLSAVIWSAVFLLAHMANGGENPLGLLCVFGAGMLFSYALWRTGSLWWGIGAHMTWDWSQSFLYGVPDSGTLSVGRLLQTHAIGPRWLSGGVDGPEGSALVLLGFFVLWLGIRLQPRGAQPSLQPEVPQAVPPTRNLEPA